MTTTARDVQNLIVLEVGDEPTDACPGGVLDFSIAAIWESFADKASVAPRLQELYAKRRCIDLVLGVVRSQVDFKIEGSHQRSQSDKAKALQAMRADCHAEIVRIEAKARANRAPAAGTITTVAPLAAPDGDPRDANSRQLRGDPYIPAQPKRSI